MPKGSKAKTASEPNKFLLVVLAIVAILAVWIYFSGDSDYSLVKFDATSVNAELAITVDERRTGLSNRPSLDEGAGMLFVFDEPDTYGFWMQDMEFSIDIIWLDEDKAVVQIERDVSPDTFPDVFYPNIPALYVLETNSGFVLENDIMLGDKAAFNL